MLSRKGLGSADNIIFICAASRPPGAVAINRGNICTPIDNSCYNICIVPDRLRTPNVDNPRETADRAATQVADTYNMSGSFCKELSRQFYYFLWQFIHSH